MKKRRLGLVVAWVVATALATVLASQAVALVRDQVTDRPSKVATTLALETTTTAAPPTTNGLTTPSSTSTTGGGTTTTVSSPTSSSTQPTVTTTSTPTTTPTTTGAGQEQTFYLTGGWATARCSGNEVALATYAPNPGYKVEIKSAGPAELRIEFEEVGGEQESKLEVRCSDGVPNPKIDEHHDD